MSKKVLFSEQKDSLKLDQTTKDFIKKRTVSYKYKLKIIIHKNCNSWKFLPFVLRFLYMYVSYKNVILFPGALSQFYTLILEIYLNFF